jgi:hypothetical protein
MNEDNQVNDTEAEVEAATPKAKTEYEDIQMLDGRTVKFAGKRQVDKTVAIVDGVATVRFDFRNGETRSVNTAELSEETCLVALGHGLSQKVGDEYSGVKEVEDMVIAAEDMIERLTKGEWSVPRQAGDGFSGASIVIKAICEATGKSVQEIKDFLAKKLEKAKENGEKLSRGELYKSFRNPASKTGAIIERMEREALSKSSKVNANDLLSELN